MATFTLSRTLSCGIRNAFELCAEETQLGMELVVATLDMLNAPDAGGAMRTEGSQKIRGAGADIRHNEIGGL